MWSPAAVQRRRQSTIMATLRIHYEGWVALPESFRRKLGLESGAEIEAELVDGTIVLRPAKGSAKPEKAGVAREAAMATPAPAILASALAEQKPDQAVGVPETPPAPKRRGRPPRAKG